MRSGAAGLLAIAFTVAGGFVIVHAVGATQAPPPRPQATALARPTTSPLPALPGSAPVRLDIERIGVHAPVAASGIDRDGQVAVPPLDQPWLTTWYDRGPSPGERGNSVIIGHVDTRKVGAAVFYSLGKLAAGDRIQVTRADGLTAIFTVDAVALVTKAQFPASDVYGPSDRPSLRLITCGGDFDSARHSYLANTVVTATLTSWHPSAARPAPLVTFIPDLPPPSPSAKARVKPPAVKPAAKPKAVKPAAKPKAVKPKPKAVKPKAVKPKPAKPKPKKPRKPKGS